MQSFVFMTLLDRLEKAIAFALSKGLATSERELSQKAGLSSGYIGRTKTGMRDNPNYNPGSKTLAQIAKVCGVRVEWLIDEAGTMTSDFVEVATLDAILASYEWPEELEPSEAAAVVRQLREEHFKNGADVPPSYWVMRIRRLTGEVQNRAKDVPRRPPSTSSSPDEESPEVREHKARRKRSPA